MRAVLSWAGLTQNSQLHFTTFFENALPLRRPMEIHWMSIYSTSTIVHRPSSIVINEVLTSEEKPAKEWKYGSPFPYNGSSHKSFRAHTFSAGRQLEFLLQGLNTLCQPVFVFIQLQAFTCLSNYLDCVSCGRTDFCTLCRAVGIWCVPISNNTHIRWVSPTKRMANRQQ